MEFGFLRYLIQQCHICNASGKCCVTEQNTVLKPKENCQRTSLARALELLRSPQAARNGSPRAHVRPSAGKAPARHHRSRRAAPAGLHLRGPGPLLTISR